MSATEPETFITDVIVDGLDAAHLVVGYDFRFGRKRRGCVDMLSKMGISGGFSVSRLAAKMTNERPYSSTLARELIFAGDVDGLKVILGYDWFFDARIGPRTAYGWRLDVPAEIAVLGDGLYSVAVSGLLGRPHGMATLVVRGGAMTLTSGLVAQGEETAYPATVRVRVLQRA